MSVFIEFELDVEADFFPGEPENNAAPGWEIDGVWLNGKDIYSLLTDAQVDEICEQLDAERAAESDAMLEREVDDALEAMR